MVGLSTTKNLITGSSDLWCDQCVWNWRDREESITFRELKSIRLLLQGNLGKQVAVKGIQELLLHLENKSVVRIMNSFVTESRSLMREFRLLKLVLSKLSVQVRVEWLPSAVTKYADALSRQFPRGDILIRQQLRRSIVDWMRAPLDAFKYFPLGDHPFIRRKLMMDDLEKPMYTSMVRLLCPPVNFIVATVNKLALTKAPAILMTPD